MQEKEGHWHYQLEVWNSEDNEQSVKCIINYTFPSFITPFLYEGGNVSMQQFFEVSCTERMTQAPQHASWLAGI